MFSKVIGLKINRLQFLILSVLVGLLLNIIYMNFGTNESLIEYLIGCLIFTPLFMFRLNDLGLNPWISFFLIIPYFTFFFYLFLLIKPGINEDIT